jgi:hypothetical protein
MIDPRQLVKDANVLYVQIAFTEMEAESVACYDPGDGSIPSRQGVFLLGERHLALRMHHPVENKSDDSFPFFAARCEAVSCRIAFHTVLDPRGNDQQRTFGEDEVGRLEVACRE